MSQNSVSQSNASPGTTQQKSSPPGSLEEIPLSLDRDNFMRTLIRELSGTLQDVVGLEEASGLISIVGRSMGQQIDQEYKLALNTDTLTLEQVGQILIDLKRRIHGDFSVESLDETKVVLYNRACPFAEKVQDRPAMCMMTSNVFGTIAADNLGYAKVDLQRTIAEGHGHCRVVVHLQLTPEAEAAQGREYFQSN